MPVVHYNWDAEEDPETQIRQAAAEVMNKLGPGYSESVYQKALETEFRIQHIHYEEQPTVNVIYKGFVVGFMKPDLVVNGNIVIELKAFGTRSNGVQQLERYLDSGRFSSGILINFCRSPVTLQVFQRESSQ